MEEVFPSEIGSSNQTTYDVLKKSAEKRTSDCPKLTLILADQINIAEPKNCLGLNTFIFMTKYRKGWAEPKKV